MPQVVPNLPSTTDPPRKRWTRAQYQSLSVETLGGERLELIEGELISKMGKKRPHVNALILLQAWLVSIFGVRFVHPEAPIDVAPEDNPSSEPEPDIIVTSRDLSHFQTNNPCPADLRLVVEIADTTLDFDLSVKARLYARACIIEYWVIDLTRRRIFAHRNPLEGHYRTISEYGEDERIAPLAAPNSELAVRDVFAVQS